MKKQILISLILFSSVLVTNAQTWSGSTPGNIYYNQGNVGIGYSSGTEISNNKLAVNGNVFINAGIRMPLDIGISVTEDSFGHIRKIFGTESVTGSREFFVYLKSPDCDYNDGIKFKSYVGSDLLTILNTGASTFSSTINTQAGYLLNGNNLFSSLSNGYLSYWNGNGLGNSPIYTDGTNISLGTSSIISPLHIANSNSALLSYSRTGVSKIWYLGADGGGTYFGNATDGENPIYISNGGNIGIGTTAPAYKLDVIGTMRAKEIKVDLNGADFVFENNYQLMPLNELEQFVKEKKHLPEVTSAKEMEENGTDLGSLNSKLLQKVEELTLYVIEQNKQIKEQNEKIEKLEKILKTIKP